METDWQRYAVCAAPWVDPVWFTDNPERAIEVCAACPVRELCLQYALETAQQGAVWGGQLIPTQRPRPAAPLRPRAVTAEPHPPSRWKFMSGRCACDACHGAAKAYDLAYKRAARAS